MIMIWWLFYRDCLGKGVLRVTRTTAVLLKSCLRTESGVYRPEESWETSRPKMFYDVTMPIKWLKYWIPNISKTPKTRVTM